jgi:hypothetical protein
MRQVPMCPFVRPAQPISRCLPSSLYAAHACSSPLRPHGKIEWRREACTPETSPRLSISHVASIFTPPMTHYWMVTPDVPISPTMCSIDFNGLRRQTVAVDSVFDPLGYLFFKPISFLSRATYRLCMLTTSAGVARCIPVEL